MRNDLYVNQAQIDRSKAKLGERITKLRIQKGLTLEKLAYESGVSKGNLSDIEQGKKDPRYSTLLKLAEGLEVKLSVLLKADKN